MPGYELRSGATKRGPEQLRRSCSMTEPTPMRLSSYTLGLILFLGLLPVSPAAAPPARRTSATSIAEPLPPHAVQRFGTTRFWHPAFVSDFAFHPLDNVVASTGGDFAIRFWNARTGEAVRAIDETPAWVRGVRYSPDGRLFASVSSGHDTLVYLRDNRSGKVLWKRGVSPARATAVPPSALAFSPDGKSIYAANKEAIFSWETATNPTRGFGRSGELPRLHRGSRRTP